tara:strand:- start:42 stop:500 length:459 start_codon:yes stop_codon:yes gene_type:complete
MSEADWTTAKEAGLWMDNYCQSNPIIKAKFDTKHARQRMLQRSEIYVIDLKDCGIWWDGYFQMHRANISRKDVTDKLECVMKIRANGLGVFTLKRGPLDSEFTVVTFYPEEGGSPEQYMINEIEVARKFGQEKRMKMLERNLEFRKSKSTSN